MTMALEDKLFLVKLSADEKSHLRVIDPQVCRTRCAEANRPCTFICPADVYEWEPEEGKLSIAYEGCLECGTCRIACPHDNLEWEYPRGGFGVLYKNG